MWVAEIISPWIGDGTDENPFGPDVGDRYMAGAYWQEGQKWEDITGTPSASLIPGPNLYNVRIEVEADVLDAISADSDFHILWSEEIIEDAI